MLSKNKLKYIKSFHRKKTRDKESIFIAEGKKLVLDLLDAGVRPHLIVSSQQQSSLFSGTDAEVIIDEVNSIKQISLLQTASEVFALFHKPKTKPLDTSICNDNVICLDEIQDPGNLGTIIRTADWFGIKNIVCLKGSAEAFNPKTIQSTMGAIARVAIHYTDHAFLQMAKDNNIPIYGCYMEGENIYKKENLPKGIIVLGNEGQGISEETAQYISNKISIPSHTPNSTSESLNVAIAGALVMGEFRRRGFV